MIAVDLAPFGRLHLAAILREGTARVELTAPSTTPDLGTSHRAGRPRRGRRLPWRRRGFRAWCKEDGLPAARRILAFAARPWDSRRYRRSRYRVRLRERGKGQGPHAWVRLGEAPLSRQSWTYPFTCGTPLRSTSERWTVRHKTPVEPDWHILSTSVLLVPRSDASTGMQSRPSARRSRQN